VDVRAENKKTKLAPVGEDEFISEESGSNYAFNRNAKGAVTGLVLLNVNGLFLTKKSE
jgi:hypothetical protein